MFLPCLNDLSCNEGCIIITGSNAAISNLKYFSLSLEEQRNNATKADKITKPFKGVTNDFQSLKQFPCTQFFL